MNIQTIETIDTSQILQVFNQSFADYLIPMKLTEEQLEFKMRSDKTDKSISVMVKMEKSLLLLFCMVNK